ncbi:hypothetical protein B0H63DRAFT_471179 [Podospora didyma]|uniref:CFEM domain-containing protein n=1 Tax=Podospora didyma TaxID=330526 RepID=A0AAE0U280_9PEZI|nr:hypothetical protein B0H63DRAFT_471179 [Podospora didyma]
MKYSLALLAAAAGAMAADTFASYGVPECAIKCLNEGLTGATKCKAEELECFCIADNYRATYTASVNCVLAACGDDVSVTEVLPAAAHLCEVVAGPYTETSTAYTTAAPVAASTTPAAASPSTTLASSSVVAGGLNGTATSATSSAPAATSSQAKNGAAGVVAGMGAAVPMLLAALF